MKTTQLYKYTTWFLLAVNIGMLLFLFFTMRPPPNREEGLAEHMKQTLNLTSEQMPIFTSSTEKYKQHVNMVSTQQKQILRAYFLTLVDVPADKEALLLQLQQLEKQKIQNSYQHLQEIKNILSPDQIPDYKQFMAEALEIMLSDKKKPNLPPKD